ncbi:MAG: DUF882 domain-containing protein [Pseudomonadota bacterium]|nr:DUF882 domain-containing protein [Pseudomonadota bacterium]
MIWTRRRLLGVGGALAGMAAAGVRARPAGTNQGAPAESASPTPPVAEGVSGAAAASSGAAKHISLQNLHTGERLHIEFFRGGEYVRDSLAAIQVLLRDFRNDEQHAIDPTLMDYLYDVARHAGADPVFSIISGYRSPQTNALLRERSSGVALRSLHLEGRAVDVRLAGVDCAALAGYARNLTRGGVGYYRTSDFVHLDTGAFRTWNG